MPQIPGKNEKQKQGETELRAKAAAGDHDASAWLENLRARKRAEAARRKARKEQGDTAAIAGIGKRSETTRQSTRKRQNEVFYAYDTVDGFDDGLMDNDQVAIAAARQPQDGGKMAAMAVSTGAAQAKAARAGDNDHSTDFRRGPSRREFVRVAVHRPQAGLKSVSSPRHRGESQLQFKQKDAEGAPVQRNVIEIDDDEPVKIDENATNAVPVGGDSRCIRANADAIEIELELQRLRCQKSALALQEKEIDLKLKLHRLRKAEI